MAWMWLRRVQYIVRQRQADADVRTELEFHRKMKLRDLEARGTCSCRASRRDARWVV